MDRQQDAYRALPDEVADIERRVTLEPVDPGEIRERADAGAVLHTTDVPDYLRRQPAPSVDTSLALYRLVQLFGTPNVPGLEAGADQGERDRTTWQYLFRVTYDPDDGADPVEVLVSVYDDKTNISVGISEWEATDEHPGRVALDPSGDPPPSGELPPEAFMVNVVKLVLSTVEHAVAATYEGLHV